LPFSAIIYRINKIFLFPISTFSQGATLEFIS
jgi:hypothetical protein